MPTSTDLVTDLPADFETFGQAVDTSLADLKGGTTGQVLAKASNTNMDFTWVAQDDSNAIQNAIVDAKGDLIAASANDTPARLAVGANGETLVADSSTSTGLRYTAGNPIPNSVINSAMQIWQRGTSFTVAASTATFTADRWSAYRPATNLTVTRQATGDTTNLPFIQYCARLARTAGDTSTAMIQINNTFESANSIPLAGKTITVSFYARKGANFSEASSNLTMYGVSGTGTDQNPYSGFTGATVFLGITATLTTTWQRFTSTATMAAGATQLNLQTFYTPTGTAGAADYFEMTGVQVDIGSVALPFRTNGATIQGELAACQRYFQRYGGASLGGEAFASIGLGYVANAAGTQLIIDFPFITSMRTAPSSVSFNNLVGNNTITDYAVSAVTLRSSQSSNSRAQLNVTIASATQHRPLSLISNGSTGFLDLNGEL